MNTEPLPRTTLDNFTTLAQQPHPLPTDMTNEVIELLGVLRAYGWSGYTSAPVALRALLQEHCR